MSARAARCPRRARAALDHDGGASRELRAEPAWDLGRADLPEPFPVSLRRTDVELAEAILTEADSRGLVTSAMREPEVRVEYATSVLCTS